ncbi:putative capsule polysaccharide synthase protein [Botrytis fragariae]|uniref:Putative capsule polysaccharide synthase protein n=1 Tax=Botrytis fragariae TaxID=1964551 RepID=A0A8H6B532_9HELO|nr:putative capsule polysaccharide synthase protein [Botrytis fragariae]KAF5879379.1 putative capsule polysaccharide synthase protein [Botrytis fragariae]
MSNPILEEMRDGAATIFDTITEAQENEELGTGLQAIDQELGHSSERSILWNLLRAIVFFFRTPFLMVSSLPFLAYSIPQSIASFIVVPGQILLSIPGVIQKLLGLALNPTLASFSATTIIGGLFFILVSLPNTKLGRGVEALHNFLCWAPIYSAVLLLSSSSEASRELFATLHEFFVASPWSAAFVFLFVFKFLKVVVHLFSYNFLSSYKLPPLHPSVVPCDVTVIITTVGEFADEFVRTIDLVLENHPAKIIISTVGTEKLIQARRVVERIMRKKQLPGRKIEVIAVHQPSKRVQCVQASLQVRTGLIAYVDDHVFWPPTFLQSVLAEFEDPAVGIVGTCKRVIREPGDNRSDSLRNFFACIYLERHNYELTSTYNIDGGLWVVSGRTCLLRTDVVQTVDYRTKFLSETFLGAGPVNCDDDNFNTRYMINHGYKTVFHNRPEALIETTLDTSGGWPKFYQQLLRWSRSIWRFHFKTILVDGTCWKFCPWTSYSMFVSGLLNISIIYDSLLFFTLLKSEYYTENNHAGAYLFWALLLSRMIKPWNYYMRNKHEMWWAVPAEILFGYFHGIIRLNALLTCRDIG